jgi:hypothetical protein
MILLTQHGEPAFLQIGVTKNEARKLDAHGWVKNRRHIVIGAAPELLGYVRLSSLEGKLL